MPRILAQPLTLGALPLVDTLLQRRDGQAGCTANRFNGFFSLEKTVETVDDLLTAPNTALKQGAKVKRLRVLPPACETSRPEVRDANRPLPSRVAGIQADGQSIQFLPFLAGFSTTGMIQKIREA